MIRIKKYLLIVICILSSLFIIFYSMYLNNNSNILNNIHEIIIKEDNEYTKHYNFMKLKQVEDYNPKSYEDLVNIYYSTINKGTDIFTFYCPTTYSNCLSDVDTISNDEGLLSNINNYVHPFNSFASIKTSYDETGEVTIRINHLYSNEDINKIMEIVPTIIEKLKIDENTSDKDKVKLIHDYIINTTKYDKNRSDGLNSEYDSSRINGLLFEHFAVCSAYADTMSLFLDYFNIENYKISSENHVWNAIKIDNTWYHLDATWDDPINESIDTLSHKYFLISTSKLKDLKESYDEHIFDEDFYPELKEEV